MNEIEPRIPTHLWVEAKIRELHAANIPTFVIHKGEKMDGVIYIKTSNCQGQCTLKTQQRDLEGVLQWINIFNDEIVNEKQADDYIIRAKERDPDMWAIEAECQNLERNLF